MEGILLWAFEGLQRLVANQFRFSESDRSRQNRELLKQDGNNLLMFLASEDYIQFDSACAATSKELMIPKGVTPHVLRHTFLTQLQAAGHVDIKTLQSIAGHSKITMTMNTYVHKDVGNVEKISRTSDGLFSRA